ncbi:MAG: dTDP-4-dehydrorhamnose 3,5-epimerase family protein [Oscillospiraceae bacterium]|nr:dTDP-4-dehydrorhamnose 3,5-epimerase family protein [Oscillospiraceae bacterium]
MTGYCHSTDRMIKKIFGCAVLFDSRRTDERASVDRVFSKSIFDEMGISFDMKTLRTYDMPKAGTFFGIHYHKAPAAKLVSVIRGKGADYTVDLRPDSPTYLRWKMNILSQGTVIYIPNGFGHAFLSLEDNTVQLFACETESPSDIINYRDERIGLNLPMPVTVISPSDRDAPFCERS